MTVEISLQMRSRIHRGRKKHDLQKCLNHHWFPLVLLRLSTQALFTLVIDETTKILIITLDIAVDPTNNHSEG